MCQGTSCPRRYPPSFRLCLCSARARSLSVEPPLSASRPRAGTWDARTRITLVLRFICISTYRTRRFDTMVRASEAESEPTRGNRGTTVFPPTERGGISFSEGQRVSVDLSLSEMSIYLTAEISAATRPRAGRPFDAPLVDPALQAGRGNGRGRETPTRSDGAEPATRAHAKSSGARARPLGMTVESPEFADCSTEFSCYVARSGRT